MRRLKLTSSVAFFLCAATLTVPAFCHEKAGIDFDSVVKLQIEKGWEIAVMDLTYKRDFWPSLGDKGKHYEVSECKILLEGNDSEHRTKNGDTKSLYHRFPIGKKVIMILSLAGHWIEYSEENEKRLVAAIEKFRKK